MQILNTIEALRTIRPTLQGRVGLVPTMGYLHDGHLALIKQARAECDSVIVTIFVNPTQFAPNEDLSTYPHDLPRDLALLESAGVSAVFTPTPDSIYPPDFQTYVTVEAISKGREGATRPAHFRGVATVVAKLFNLTQPDVAYFGQKDAQQVAVIRQMQRDLNFPLAIVVCPIIREPDGLAMSSRNVYLSLTERTAARVLSLALNAVAQEYENGARDPDYLRAIAHDKIQAEPLAQLDYVSLATAHNLTEVNQPTEVPLLLSVAARLGKTRLIDNYLLPAHLNTVEGATATLGSG